jgi:hypothetical protein
LEHLSDAYILGKLLVLPANFRLDWKVIARYEHSSLFGLIVSNEGKKFYNIDTSKALLSLKTATNPPIVLGSLGKLFGCNPEMRGLNPPQLETKKKKIKYLKLFQV